MGGAQIELFSSVHLVSLAIVFLFAWFVLRKKQSVAGLLKAKPARAIVGFLLIFLELGWMFFSHVTIGAPWLHALPLHLCDLGTLCALWWLVDDRPLTRELLFFTGAPGALLAMLFPDIWEPGWIRSLATIRFFAAHGLNLALGLFVTCGLNYLPPWSSLGKVCAVFFLVFLPLALGANLYWNQNFLFLMSPPTSAAWLANLSWSYWLIYPFFVCFLFVGSRFAIAQLCFYKKSSTSFSSL